MIATMPLEILAIPVLRDNYVYVLVDGTDAVVVDPGEAAPVARVLGERGLVLSAIWCTHHHLDHVGGIAGLRAEGLPVVGGRYDHEHHRIPAQTQVVSEGDHLEHGGVRFDILEVPGHTLGAIAFVGGGVAFTGDMLFLGGCGRVFEGTMPMMRASLERLARLDPETRLYCGHEYTEANLRFALHVEPESMAIRERLEAVRAVRARSEPTVPGRLGDELATNPFLRSDRPAVREFAARRGEASTADEVFARVREAKNEF